MNEDHPPIVIDSGSGNCRAGFAGDDAPRSVFSSVIGRPRFKFHTGEIVMDDVVGDDAQMMREFVSLKYPIERGIVTNWDEAEKIWDFCFNDLKVDPSAHPVIMSEPVLNPASNKEHMAESMFETFNVPAYFSHNSATLSLYQSGRGVGVIVDIGDGITHVVPIHLTSKNPHANQYQEFGGRDVTLYLQKLLHERGYSFTTTAEFEYVREIKEELCYVSKDFNREMSEPINDISFALPDGNQFTIGQEKFQCAECLFQPALAGYDGMKGLPDMLKSCLDNCDIDIRKDFYCNILLCGGATLMPNLPKRLEDAWKRLIPPTMVGQIVSRVERAHSVWIGGSIAASLSTFQKAWITKGEYEEFGPSIVHKRCL